MTETERLTFGRWMLHRRVELNVSLRKLEKLTGIGNTTLSYIERQGQSPKLTDFVKICEGLNADCCEVLAIVT